MKLRKLFCLTGAMMLLFLSISCEVNKFRYVESTTVIINNLPEDLFPAGTTLYCGVGTRYNVMGNGLVDSSNAVNMPLHYPTGYPFSTYYYFESDNSQRRLSIYKDIFTKERLYITRSPVVYRHSWNTEKDLIPTFITLDFLTDFVEAE